MKTIGTAAAIALSVSLMGCTTEETAEDTAAPTFDEGSGQETWNEAANPDYPAVTGYDLGSAIPNYKFIGYANYANLALAGQVQFMQLADLYNPDGAGVYPEGSVYGAGTPKPKALVLSKSAVWCPPCNLEAEVGLPEEYPIFQPMGGQFLSVIIEGGSGGKLATYDDLTNWADDYMTGWSAADGSVYMLALDPERNTQIVQESPWPSNMIIRTSDMMIMYIHAGAIVRNLDGQTIEGAAEFWEFFEGVLDGTITEPQENPFN